jgi:hypothetical protein
VETGTQYQNKRHSSTRRSLHLRRQVLAQAAAGIQIPFCWIPACAGMKKKVREIILLGPHFRGDTDGIQYHL